MAEAQVSGSRGNSPFRQSAGYNSALNGLKASRLEGIIVISQRVAARVIVGFLLPLASMAAAHPLGDFSINQYFVVDGRGPVLRLHYLLDVAEIPSFTELDMLDTNFDSEITKEEVEGYLAQRIPQLEAQLALTMDGHQTPLTLLRHKLVLLQGNSGMVVFNILLDFEARELAWPPSQTTSLSIQSDNYPLEQGTHECLLLTGKSLADATETMDGGLSAVVEVPGAYTNREATFQLTLRAEASPTATAEVTEAQRFGWTSTARLAEAAGETGMSEGMAQAMVEPGFQDDFPGGPGKPILSIANDVSSETFETGTRTGENTYASRLMNRVSIILRAPELPPSLLLLGLFIAALLGMGHAWAPGHGKTVMAAYLVGERGTVWHALVLGIVVTITHTWSVIFLGLVTLYFDDWLSEEQVNFWTGIISGLIIVFIGLVLFRQRYYRLLASAQDKGGDWQFFHGHDHLPEETTLPSEPGVVPTYRNILWLGVSGGIVPCPAALIVLLLALKVGRLGYGLGLLVAFSLGLAAVLVLIGIIVVRASQLAQRRSLLNHPFFQALPLASAGLITLLGGWVVFWTLLQFNLFELG